MSNRFLNVLSIAVFVLLIPAEIFGQLASHTIVKGTITDGATGEPIPLVAVEFVKTSTGTTTDADGHFLLTGKNISNKIRFSCLGYETQEFIILTGQTQEINVRMKPISRELKEVVIKPEKKRYRNKGNQAVELIQKVISRKNLNQTGYYSTIQYERYEKTQFALSNLTEEFKNKKFLRKVKFIFQNVDSTKLSGKQVLPVYLRESLSDISQRNSPPAKKEVVKAEKMVKFEGYLNDQGMDAYLKYMYQDINIYNQDIMFLTNIFLSPVATTAPQFYRYYIRDTISIDSTRCYKLLFAPRNKTDMLFQGFLYITADSNYAIRKLEMSVPSDINLNWAKEVHINQEFSKADNAGWLLSNEQIGIDFGLVENRLGIYGERLVSYRYSMINGAIADTVFDGQRQNTANNAEARSVEFWNEHRHVPLSSSESRTYSLMDSVKNVRAFRSSLNIAMLLFAGYRTFGPVEIGPVNTFYSYNPIEGYRIRVGGRTTPQFSKRFTLETYGAYGFRDQKFKYFLGATLSLTQRTIWDFPVKYIKLSYQDETKIPGQELQFVQEDNFLLSFKRGVNNKLLYNKTIKIEHLNEFPNHFSYNIAYQFLRQRPGGDLFFNKVDYMLHVNDPPFIDISEFTLSLRYAPEEKFYQGKQYRIPMANKYPVTQLTFIYGSTAFGNDYDYLNVKLSVSKRFYLSVLGYTDVVAEGGKIFGQVPFPLLYIHRANQTYSYQLGSYNLMNFLEFVSDEYCSINLDHCFNGFLFNKIPLLKKLKWREYISGKILWGRLTELNNPDTHPDLFKFPVDYTTPVTFTLHKGPYVEVSAGIGNILKLFRVEFVSRLTYLEQPFVARYGIRVRFKFDF